MKPTTSRKTILVGLAALALIAVFFVVSVQRGAKPQGGFAPPVYANGDSPTELIRPLYLGAPSSGAPAQFSAEDAQRIADFKRKILARVSSGAPLAREEKTVLAISVATTAEPAIGALVVADQTVLQFSGEELSMISRALGQ